MMRILLATPYDDGIPMHSGGIALWAKNLDYYYQNLGNNSGVQLDIFPCNRSKYVKLEDSLLSRLYAGLKDYVIVLIRVVRIIRKKQYDLLHFCSSASLGLLRDWLLIWMSHLYNVKFILHLRFGRIPELSMKNNWEWKLLKKVIAVSDGIIVIDQQSYNILRKERFDNIFYLPNPLQPKTEKIISDNYGLQRKEREVLFVGHVIKTKGIEELVEACMKLDNIKLKIVGLVMPEYKTYLQNIVESKLGSYIEFMNQLDYLETIKSMLQTNVFVLPSYTEGFPNVILEAMACSCPIVSTDVGAIPEMLDIEHGNNYGICVKPKDVEGLRNAIQQMVEDKEYATFCGKNANKRVHELYSISKVWEQLILIWNKVNRNQKKNK